MVQWRWYQASTRSSFHRQERSSRQCHPLDIDCATKTALHSQCSCTGRKVQSQFCILVEVKTKGSKLVLCWNYARRSKKLVNTVTVGLPSLAKIRFAHCYMQQWHASTIIRETETKTKCVAAAGATDLKLKNVWLICTHAEQVTDPVSRSCSRSV